MYETSIDTSEWKEYKLTDLFDFTIGKTYKNSDALANIGETPFISSTALNNGVFCYTNLRVTDRGNCLTLNKDGSVGEVFYQEKDFVKSTHVIVARYKYDLNSRIGLFISTILQMEKFKYSFGRAWNLERVNNTTIKLPSKLNLNNQYEPDYEYMENFIKSLPYSAICEGGGKASI